MKEKAFVSAVIYSYNNESVIRDKIIEIDNYLNQFFENYELIIVNDGSVDDTLKCIKQLTVDLHKDYTIVTLPWVHGPDNGIIAGIDLAIGDFIYEIEIDKMDYPLTILSDLFDRINQGYDIVSGKPVAANDASLRVFFGLLNLFSNLPMTIERETIRILSRRAINAISGIKERIRYRKILYQYSGFPSSEIEYSQICKHCDTEKMSLKEKIDFFITVIVSYSHIGPSIALFLALFFLIISTIIGIYSIGIFLLTKNVMEGWTTLMLFMSFSFSGIFLILAILGRYISTILFEIKERPLYTVSSYEKIKVE